MTVSVLRLGLHIGKLRPSPAPAAIVNAIQSVDIHQSDASSGSQGFSITFRADRRAADGNDFALLTHPLLKTGQRIVISVTLNAAQYVLMDGIIGHTQLNPAAGEQGATITVTGEDLSVLLDLVDINMTLPPLGHLGIVHLILVKYLPLGIHADVKKPRKDLRSTLTGRVPFQDKTDLKYLRELAAQHGYIFMIKPGPTPGSCQAYWGPPPRNKKPQKALTVNMGTASNVQSIDFSYDGRSPTQIFGLIANPNVPLPVPVLGLVDIRRHSLADEKPLLHNQPFIRKTRLGHKGDSIPKAYKAAGTAVNQSTESIVQATGVLNVMKYGTILTAPGIVGLRGVGHTFDGNYYVQSVSHQISLGSYTQKFTLTREGPKTTVNKVDV